MKGVREHRRMIPVFCNQRSKKCLSSDQGENLFSEMISSGSDIRSATVFQSADATMAAYHVAVEESGLRSSRIIQLVRDRDRAFRARRGAAVSAYFDKRISRQEELASEHVVKGSSESVIKGFRTRVERLKEEKRAKIDEINNHAFDPGQEKLCGGIVRVKK